MESVASSEIDCEICCSIRLQSFLLKVSLEKVLNYIKFACDKISKHSRVKVSVTIIKLLHFSHKVVIFQRWNNFTRIDCDLRHIEKKITSNNFFSWARFRPNQNQVDKEKPIKSWQNKSCAKVFIPYRTSRECCWYFWCLLCSRVREGQAEIAPRHHLEPPYPLCDGKFQKMHAVQIFLVVVLLHHRPSTLPVKSYRGKIKKKEQKSS